MEKGEEGGENMFEKVNCVDDLYRIRKIRELGYLPDVRVYRKIPPRKY